MKKENEEWVTKGGKQREKQDGRRIRGEKR